jgi:2-polyprenyl-3-methyl-5-hydroxy-6-metoxy-1,4-benzoquinol methylase
VLGNNDMSQKRGYQLHLSRGDATLKDVEGRKQKYEKILAVLQDFCKDSGPSNYVNCLDIGCSAGIITSLLGNHFQMSIGVDIDQEAVQYARGHSLLRHVHFLTADSMMLPFRNNSIDVVVCNHIYEHVPSADRLMDEIHRILKKEGVCYFSAGNKYMITEGHYGLPFLSWVPKRIAHLYLRLTGKGEFYYEEHRSLRKLKQLVKKFQIHDYTLSVIRDPEKFSAADILNTQTLLYKWIRWIAPFLYPWIPTYIWILTKSNEKTQLQDLRAYPG